MLDAMHCRCPPCWRAHTNTLHTHARACNLKLLVACPRACLLLSGGLPTDRPDRPEWLFATALKAAQQCSPLAQELQPCVGGRPAAGSSCPLPTRCLLLIAAQRSPALLAHLACCCPMFPALHVPACGRLCPLCCRGARPAGLVQPAAGGGSGGGGGGRECCAGRTLAAAGAPREAGLVWSVLVCGVGGWERQRACRERVFVECG